MFPFFERESPSLNEDLPKHPIKPHIDEVPVRTEEETYNDLTSIRFLRNDAAPGITVSPSGLTLRGAKGYRTVRASHGISAGDMYFEVRINEPVDDIPRVVNSDITSYVRPSALTQLDASSLFLPEPSRLSEEPHLITGHEGHIRIGYCTPQSPVCLPVGTTHGSFAYKGLDGSKGSYSVMEQYGEPYGPGDVVGCFIHLPHRRVKALLEDQPLLEVAASPIVMSAAELFVQTMMAAHGELGIQDVVIPPVMDEIPDSPLTFEDAFICFYKNGVCQGTAFHHLPQGLYLPAVSLYMYASVTVNFGPDFLYPPPELTFPRIVRVPSDGLYAGEECLPDDVEVTCEIEAIDRKICSEIRKKQREKQLEEEHILQHGYNLHGMREPVVGRGRGEGRPAGKSKEREERGERGENRDVKREEGETEQEQGNEKVLKMKQEDSEETLPSKVHSRSKQSMALDDGSSFTLSTATRMTDTMIDNQNNSSSDGVVIPGIHSGDISVFPPIYQQDMRALRSRSEKSLGKILRNSGKSEMSQNPEIVSQIRALLSTRPQGHTWQLRLSRHFDTRYSCLYRSIIPNIQSSIRERKRAQIKKEQEKKRKSNTARSRKKKPVKRDEEEEEGKSGTMVQLTSLSSSTSASVPLSASSPSSLSQPTSHTRRSGARSEFKLEPVVSGPVIPAPVATLSLSAPVFSGQSSTTSSHSYTPVPTELPHTPAHTEAQTHMQTQAHMACSSPSAMAPGLRMLHSFAPSPSESPSSPLHSSSSPSSPPSPLPSSPSPSSPSTLAPIDALSHAPAPAPACTHSPALAHTAVHTAMDTNAGLQNNHVGVGSMAETGGVGGIGVGAGSQYEDSNMTDDSHSNGSTTATHTTNINIHATTTASSVDPPASPASPSSPVSPTSLSNTLSTTSTTSATSTMSAVSHTSLSSASTSSSASVASHASTTSNISTASTARPSSRATNDTASATTSTSAGAQPSVGGPSLDLMPRVFPPWSSCVHKVLRWRLIGPQILVPNPRLETEGTYVYVANTEGPGEDLRVGIPKNIEIPDGKGMRKQNRECSRSAHSVIGTGTGTSAGTGMSTGVDMGDVATSTAASLTRNGNGSCRDSSGSNAGAGMGTGDDSRSNMDSQTWPANASLGSETLDNMSLGSETPVTATLASLANMSGYCSVTGPSMQDIRIGISLVSSEIELTPENRGKGPGTRAVKCMERVIGITPPTAVTASHVPVASTHAQYSDTNPNTDTNTSVSTSASNVTSNTNTTPIPEATAARSSTDNTDTNANALTDTDLDTHIDADLNTGTLTDTSTAAATADSANVAHPAAAGGSDADTTVGVAAEDANVAAVADITGHAVAMGGGADASMNTEIAPIEATVAPVGMVAGTQALPNIPVLGLPDVDASNGGEVVVMMDDGDRYTIEHIIIGDNRNACGSTPSNDNGEGTMVHVNDGSTVSPYTNSSETTEDAKSAFSHPSMDIHSVSQEANANMNDDISARGDAFIPSPNTLNREVQQGTNDSSIHVDGTIGVESDTNK